MDYTQDQILARYEELPEDVKQAITSSSVEERITEIAKKHKLHVDQAGELIDETGLMMLGLTKPDHFVDNVAKRLGVDYYNAVEIVGDVNDQILKPIRESLREVHARPKEENPAQTEAPNLVKHIGTDHAKSEGEGEDAHKEPPAVPKPPAVEKAPETPAPQSPANTQMGDSRGAILRDIEDPEEKAPVKHTEEGTADSSESSAEAQEKTYSAWPSRANAAPATASTPQASKPAENQNKERSPLAAEPEAPSTPRTPREQTHAEPPATTPPAEAPGHTQTPPPATDPFIEKIREQKKEAPSIPPAPAAPATTSKPRPELSAAARAALEAFPPKRRPSDGTDTPPPQAPAHTPSSSPRGGEALVAEKLGIPPKTDTVKPAPSAPAPSMPHDPYREPIE